MKTLVIVLCETRAHKLTYDSFKKHLLDPLQADLCLCIGRAEDYDYTNKFYTNATHKHLINEPENWDFGPLFEDEYREIIESNNIDITKNHLHWREFLKLNGQLMGGIKDEKHQHTGSGAIPLFFRRRLHKYLIKNNLISIYDRFVITRSDFLYTMDHAPIELLNEDNIWIPNGEDYGGYTDRHAVLSKTNINEYLNIFECMIKNSFEYFEKMKNKEWNIERLIKFHLDLNKKSVKRFPYVMFAVREKGGKTSFSKGKWNKKLGFFIKYKQEYKISQKHFSNYRSFRGSIYDFYKTALN